MLKEIY